MPCRPAVLALMDKKEAIAAEIAAQKRLTTAQAATIDKITKIQGRLRENIKGLEKVSAGDLLKRYLKDLDTQEDQLLAASAAIEALNDRVFDASARLASARLECGKCVKAALEACEA